MKHDIKIECPGVVRQMKKKRERIKYARLGIRQKRRPHIDMRIPERDREVGKALRSVPPDRIIKPQDVPADEGHAAEQHIMKNETKNQEIQKKG